MCVCATRGPPSCDVSSGSVPARERIGICRAQLRSVRVLGQVRGLPLAYVRRLRRTDLSARELAVRDETSRTVIRGLDTRVTVHIAYNRFVAGTNGARGG